MGSKTSKLADALAQLCFTYGEDVAHPAAIAIAKKWLAENVFTAFKIARLMDLNGGTLNLEALTLLRTLETNNEKYVRGTILPSASSVQRVFRKVEQVGDVLVPYELSYTADGEAVDFEHAHMIRELMSAFQLTDKAKENVTAWSSTIDGARLTRGVNHVTSGIKARDRDAIDPLTGLPIFRGANSTVQSRGQCFPTNIHLGDETKDKMKEFSSLFNKMDEFAEHGVPSVDGGPPTAPIEHCVDCDMKSQWAGLCRGGGSANHKNPCHCCSVHRDMMHKCNTSLCARYCSDKTEDPDWRCFHRPIVTDEVLKSWTDDAVALQAAMQVQLQDIAASRMSQHNPSSNTGQTSGVIDPRSIWFEPQTVAEIVGFSNLLNNELQLRGEVSPGTSINVRREHLRACLVREKRLRDLLEDIRLNKRPDTALFVLMNTVPCILHLENQVGLKKMQLLLVDGIENASDGKGRFGSINGKNKRIESYLKEVESIVNQTILGSPWSPAQWKTHYDYNTKN